MTTKISEPVMAERKNKRGRPRMVENEKKTSNMQAYQKEYYKKYYPENKYRYSKRKKDGYILSYMDTGGSITKQTKHKTYNTIATELNVSYSVVYRIYKKKYKKKYRNYKIVKYT